MESYERLLELADAPYNIDPAVEAILKAVDDGLEKARDTGKPLVLLMGENHASPINHMVQLAAIDALLKKGFNIRIGDEEDSTSMLRFIHKKRVFPPSTEFAKYINKAFEDKDLAHRLMAPRSANYRFARLSFFLKSEKIADMPVALDHNDYPRLQLDNGLCLLDHSFYYYDKDESEHRLHAGALKLIQQSGISEHEERALDVRDVHGMMVRNLYMAQRIIEKSKTYKPDIYIQLTGQNHVLGGGDFQYSGSIDGFLTHQGFHTIPVCFLSSEFSEEFGPDGISIFMDRGVLINGLSEEIVIYNEEDMLGLVKILAEKAEIKKVMQHSSFAENIFDIKQVDQAVLVVEMLWKRGIPDEFNGKEKESLFDDIQRAARAHRKKERQTRKNKEAGLKHV